MRSASSWIVGLAASGCVLGLVVIDAGACKSAESKAPGPTATAAAPAPAGADDHIAVPGAPRAAGPAEVGKVDPAAAQGPAAPAAPAAADGAGAGAAVAADSGTPDSSFDLRIAPPADAKAGAEAIAHIVITPGKGYHVNQDYPVKLTLEPPSGVTIAKATQVKADAAQMTASKLAFDVKLTPAKAGSYSVTGQLKFAVCTESTCDPKKRPIAFQLAAK
jgi:hypothetical protein